MQESKNFYDTMPYFSAAFTDSSVLRLEAIANFLNLKPKEHKNARILELGCSYGGNILPFALYNQNAEIFGIDISSTQINKGKEISASIGLSNFHLIQKDILKIDQNDIKNLGKFDYIIAHGLYSWVGDDVKNAALALIKKLLNQNGIAYISYNVYPGWQSLNTLREYMLFVTANEKNPTNRILKAKKELQFFKDYLKTTISMQTNPTLKDTDKLMLTQINFLQNIIKDDKNDYYFLHDFLENSNDPIYFYKFAQILDKFDFSYLLDSSLDDIFRSSLGFLRFDNYLEANYKTRIEKEQIRDFVFNRSFRRSIITHKLSSDEFEIGQDEISKLNLIVNLSKKGEIFCQKDRNLDVNLNEIYQQIYDKSPNSINLSDFEDKNKAMSAILNLMSDQNTIISSKKFTILDYEKGKSKLKANLKEYFEYFIGDENPVISLANELNKKLDLDKDELKIALNFDGKKSLFEIEKEFGNKTIKVYEILKNNYFFEKI